MNLSSLAHNLSRLVAGLALPPVSSDEAAQGDALEDSLNERDRKRARALRLQNDDGALTWKDSCAGERPLVPETCPTELNCGRSQSR